MEEPIHQRGSEGQESDVLVVEEMEILLVYWHTSMIFLFEYTLHT